MRKTKLIALLLAVAAIASMVVPSVSAAGVTSATCPCATCNGSVPTWEAWDEVKVKAGGHYYLTGNIDLEAQVTIAESATTCVNLAGYTITAKEDKRVFGNKGTLTIIDSVGGGTLKGNGVVKASNGGVIRNESTGTLYLYAGTLTGGETGINGSGGKKSGGNIHNDGTAYIYGGTITGGKSANIGGNVCNYGKMYIYGGTISGGTAASNGNELAGTSETYIFGGTITGTDPIYHKGGILNVYGGTLGKIKLVESAALTMFGGSIAGIDNADSTVKLFNGVMGEAPADGQLAACATVHNVDGSYLVVNSDETCTDCEFEAALASYSKYITVIDPANPSVPSTPSTPQTGDNFSLHLYMGLMAFCLAALSVLLLTKKRNADVV